MIRFVTTVLCAALLPAAVDARPRPRPKPGRPMRLTATAYCQHGTTKSGAQTHRGTMAADPRVLPVGSIVRLESRTPQFSGTYTVMDTGAKIKGHRVDIFEPSCAKARQFGKRVVIAKVVGSRVIGTQATPRRRPNDRTAPGSAATPAPVVRD